MMRPEMVVYGSQTRRILLLPNIDCFSSATPITVAGMLPTRITSPTTLVLFGNSCLRELASNTTTCALPASCSALKVAPSLKVMP